MALPVGLLGKGLLGVAAVVAPISAYVIPREINKNRLRKENKEFNEKITALGITDTTCHFEDIKDKAECELDEAKVKAIKFSNKTDASTDLQVSGLSPNKKLNLVIEKGYDNSDFHEGLRFTFTNTDTTTEVKIGTNGSDQITLKAGVSYDFKMKSDDKTKLEKAWSLETLGAKVGLSCTGGDTTTECALKTSGINVWKSEEDYITGATQTDSNKKICITKDQQGYPEGFKFAIKADGEDITLTGGTKKKGDAGISKLTKENMSYGIDVKDIDGTKTWFLVEKSTTTG